MSTRDVVKRASHMLSKQPTTCRPPLQRKMRNVNTVADLSREVELGEKDDSDFVFDEIAMQKLREDETQEKKESKRFLETTATERVDT